MILVGFLLYMAFGLVISGFNNIPVIPNNKSPMRLFKHWLFLSLLGGPAMCVFILFAYSSIGMISLVAPFTGAVFIKVYEWTKK